MDKMNVKKIVRAGLCISVTMGTLFIMLSSFALCAEGEVTAVNAIRVEEADSAEAKIIIEGEADLAFRDFKIAKPPMIVVEVLNATHKIAQKKISVNKGVVKSIRSSQFRVKPESTVRVVVDLTEMSAYEISKGENSLVVKVKQPQNMDAGEPEVKAEEIKAVQPPVAEPAPAVSESDAAETKMAEAELKNPEPVKFELEPEKKPVEAKTETKPEEKAEEAKEEVEVVEEKAKLDKEQTISLDFKDADIRDVLKVLSIKSGINMVYGEDVKAEITVHLDKVNFQDALNIILRLAGLTYDYLAPNVMRIMTPNKIKEEQSLFVTQTGIFAVNYAKAAELQSVLTPLLSSQGKIQIDVRTNSIIVTDLQDNIKRTVEMLKVLDVPTPQVMIEAQIVSINKDAMKDIGVNWKFTKTWSDSGKTPVEDYAAGATSVTGKQGRIDVANIGAAPGVFSIGKVINSGGEWTDLNAVLGALETKGKGKILSSPKIATLNNQAASIMSGKKVAYTSLTSQAAGGTTTAQVNFLDVGIKLDVTPSINMDKKIIMKVHAEVSSIGNVPPGATVPPPINTRSADTNILAANGETLVIGGLIDEQTTENLSRIPFIGEIPILGQLFSHKTSTTTKTELLVFITPHIM